MAAPPLKQHQTGVRAPILEINDRPLPKMGSDPGLRYITGFCAVFPEIFVAISKARPP
jgi:hypothetical protein